MYLTGFADESGAPIANQIKATKELGWGNIELRNTGFSGDIANMTDVEFDQLCAALDGSGVRVNCFGSGIANWGKDIAAPEEDTYNEVKRALPRLQKLQVPLVRIMSYSIRKNPETGVALPDAEQMFPERVKRLKRVIAMFLDAGVQPVHENCMNYGGMCWQNTLKLIENVPDLKLVYDTGNPPFSPDMGKGIYTEPIPRQSSWEFYSHVREHIAYIHIKDATWETTPCEPGKTFPGGSKFTWAGEGNGDVRKIVKDLLDRGYDGGISMEPHIGSVFHEKDSGNAEEALYKSYVEYGQRFMKLLEELGHPLSK